MAARKPASRQPRLTDNQYSQYARQIKRWVKSANLTAPEYQADSRKRDEWGIVGEGVAHYDGKPHVYVLEDASQQCSPEEAAQAVVMLYHKLGADSIVAESNNGGEMVALTIHTVDRNVPVKLVHASRGKQARAEPISAIYQQNRAHHVGRFSRLEDELCQWEPGGPSPNRLDALVWGATELIGSARGARST